MFEVDGMPTPFLFPEHVQHVDAAFSYQQRMNKSPLLVDLVSAGFCSFRGKVDVDGIEVKTFGQSQSLNLSPAPGDAEIIQMHLEMKSSATPPEPQPQFA